MTFDFSPAHHRSSDLWWAWVIVPFFSKYGPSLSKAVGPVDPSFIVVKKSHFNKKYSSYGESSNSTKQKVLVGSQYSKTYLKQPLKKDKDLNNK